MVQNQRDAAYNQLARRLAVLHDEQVHGVGDVVRAQHQPVGDKVHIAQLQARAVAHGIKVGPVGPVGNQRVVMPVDQRERLGQNERLHRHGVGGGDADGHKSLPGAARGRDARADRLQQTGRQVEHGQRGRGPDERLKERGRMGDDRNHAAAFVRRQPLIREGREQQIAGCHVLRRQNLIQRLQRELPPAVQEIRQMRLPKAGLTGEQRDTEHPPLNPAQQLQSESLLH